MASKHVSRDPALVDRDQQILSRLARIEHKVDSIDQTNAFALRADETKHQASVKAIFGGSVRRAQVYLAADGTRTVQEIATFLNMVRPNVSRELSELTREGLLEITESSADGDVYSKKAVDRTLRITSFLCKEYSLDKSGRALKGKVAKKSRRKNKA